jgi:hypothetical protein
VTAKLPEQDDEFQYHIKHTSEVYERIVRESETQPALTVGQHPFGVI